MNDRVGFVDATAEDAKSLRWIQDRMDDLDVCIAMKEFEEAVQGMEKGTSALFPTLLSTSTLHAISQLYFFRKAVS
jgi:hypothetical protein